jgi:hypothetical protein
MIGKGRHDCTHWEDMITGAKPDDWEDPVRPVRRDPIEGRGGLGVWRERTCLAQLPLGSLVIGGGRKSGCCSTRFTPLSPIGITGEDHHNPPGSRSPEDSMSSPPAVRRPEAASLRTMQSVAGHFTLVPELSSRNNVRWLSCACPPCSLWVQSPPLGVGEQAIGRIRRKSIPRKPKIIRPI